MARDDFLPSIFRDSFFPTLMRNISYFDEPSLTLSAAHDSNLSISEDENNIYIEAALPGIKKKQIEITHEKGVVWIKGDATEEEKDKKRKYYKKSNKSFSYQIALPGNVDENLQPKADFNDGVLSITFSKLKKTPPKRISIN